MCSTCFHLWRWSFCPGGWAPIPHLLLLLGSQFLTPLSRMYPFPSSLPLSRSLLPRELPNPSPLPRMYPIPHLSLFHTNTLSPSLPNFAITHISLSLSITLVRMYPIPHLPLLVLNSSSLCGVTNYVIYVILGVDGDLPTLVLGLQSLISLPVSLSHTHTLSPSRITHSLISLPLSLIHTHTLFRMYPIPHPYICRVYPIPHLPLKLPNSLCPSLCSQFLISLSVYLFPHLHLVVPNHSSLFRYTQSLIYSNYLISFPDCTEFFKSFLNFPIIHPLLFGCSNPSSLSLVVLNPSPPSRITESLISLWYSTHSLTSLS